MIPPQGPPLGAAVYNSTDIRFEDNLFTHTNEALDFFNITRAWIDRNRIDTTLSSGIRFDAPVSPPPPATQVPANNHYVWILEHWLPNVNTSQAAGHPEAIPVLGTDFEPGGALHRASFALPHRLVTANEVCERRAVGRLNSAKLQEIRERVCATIRQS